MFARFQLGTSQQTKVLGFGVLWVFSPLHVRIVAKLLAWDFPTVSPSIKFHMGEVETRLLYLRNNSNSIILFFQSFLM